MWTLERFPDRKALVTTYNTHWLRIRSEICCCEEDEDAAVALAVWTSLSPDERRELVVRTQDRHRDRRTLG